MEFAGFFRASAIGVDFRDTVAEIGCGWPYSLVGFPSKRIALRWNPRGQGNSMRKTRTSP